MGDLARHLGVSVPFLSAVETDQKPPLTPDKIILAAEFLQVDAEPLIKAASASTRSGKLRLDLPDAPARALSVFAGLGRRLNDLTDEEIEKLEKFAEDLERKHGNPRNQG